MMDLFHELSCLPKWEGGTPGFGGVHLTPMRSFAVAELSLVQRIVQKN
jgi:hypothetical protein